MAMERWLNVYQMRLGMTESDFERFDVLCFENRVASWNTASIC
jgi:hypothetical protein